MIRNICKIVYKIIKVYALVNKFCIVDKSKSKTRINAYEINAVRISFFPTLILSSSPKLNFFIKTPAQTATAAAGVDRLTSQDSIF